ncbi:MAG TPA: isochorismatase family cysteine hydrolase [Anaerolineales bacterium]|nr:isochorismatase family cysteine hydrolase [Anaerolineales bacterium]
MTDTLGVHIAWVRDGLPFLDYIDGWATSLQPLPLRQAVEPVSQTAIACVDIINGFCREGPLASPRVAHLVPTITSLFQRAWDSGVRNLLLLQDAHDPQAVEFAHYPPHCVRGTSQAETVAEIRALPFFDRMQIFEKNSIHAGLNTGLGAWIDSHPEVTRYLVLGDCTDLCTYQLAMHLRLDANARQLARRVIVPADAVDTYDLPPAAASIAGAVPHDAGVLQHVFLYSLMLNGVEVVASIR